MNTIMILKESLHETREKTLIVIFSKYAFAIVLIPVFIYLSELISIPKTNDASPRSFTLKLEDKTFSSPMTD